MHLSTMNCHAYRCKAVQHQSCFWIQLPRRYSVSCITNSAYKVFSWYYKPTKSSSYRGFMPIKHAVTFNDKAWNWPEASSRPGSRIMCNLEIYSLVLDWHSKSKFKVHFTFESNAIALQDPNSRSQWGQSEIRLDSNCIKTQIRFWTQL